MLLFAFILAVASPAAKYVVNNYGEQILGRQLHVDRVIINPYWGGVTINGFECKELNGETNFVSFDRLYVQIALPQLVVKRVTLRHIHLDGFNGQVLKNNDKVNFSDIIERFSKKDTIQPEDATKSGWKVKLKDIRINNSNIRYRDVISDKQWKLEDLSLMASKVAKLLRGKYKPSFTPNVDCGDNVIIVNAAKVQLTGNKWNDRVYVRYTGFPGGQREFTPADLMAKGADKLVRRVVKGMLPKNRLGARQITNLYIFEGPEHNMQAQQPKNIDINILK